MPKRIYVTTIKIKGSIFYIFVYIANEIAWVSKTRTSKDWEIPEKNYSFQYRKSNKRPLCCLNFNGLRKVIYIDRVVYGDENQVSYNHTENMIAMNDQKQKNLRLFLLNTKFIPRTEFMQRHLKSKLTVKLKKKIIMLPDKIEFNSITEAANYITDNFGKSSVLTNQVAISSNLNKTIRSNGSFVRSIYGKTFIFKNETN